MTAHVLATCPACTTHWTVPAVLMPGKRTPERWTKPDEVVRCRCGSIASLSGLCAEPIPVPVHAEPEDMWDAFGDTSWEPVQSSGPLTMWSDEVGTIIRKEEQR